MQNAAVIYARYSSDKQTEQSIEGQLRVCYEFAKRCGYEVVGEYIDRAMSGTNDNRPDFQKMIADSSKTQFNFVIVYKFDRFARNRYDSAIYKNKLKKNNVRVVSATEQLGDGDESLILEAVLEAMAETYSKQLSQNVKRGMKETALKGQCTGGTIPLGYLIKDKMLVIDKEKAEIVKKIFELYINGKTKTSIARYLNENGYRSAKNGLFNISKINYILQNKMYMGNYNFKGEIERKCPKIIDVDTFIKAQEQLEISKKQHGRSAKNVVNFELTGKLFCGICGSPMAGDSGRSRNGEQHFYYTCSKRKNYRRMHTEKCEKKSEKKGFIEWYVAEQTIEYVLTPEKIEYIANKVVELYEKEYNDTEIKKLEKRVSKLNDELDKCVDSLMNTKVQKIIDKINENAERIESQLNDLEIELTKMKIAAKATITKDEIKRMLKSYCRGDLFDSDFRRKIFDTFVNAVYLFDDKVVIYYNLKKQSQVSHIEMLDHLQELDDVDVLAVDSVGSQLCLIRTLS